MKQKARVGLDIGTYGVKIVEISSVGDKNTLTGLGIKEVSGSSRDDVAGVLASAMTEAGISTKEVVVSVSGSSVIVRLISMPKMREDEMGNAVRFEAEKVIPFDMKECIIDFQILNKETKDSKFQVILVAVKKDHVMNKIKLAEKAGLNARIVDVDNFAVANSFMKNFNEAGTDKTFALINIGASVTNLCILNGGAPRLLRDIGMGGRGVTSAIAKAAGIDAKSAEEMKVSAKDNKADIENFIKAGINNLTDELKLSFSYYENQYGRNVDEIYLSGGGAMQPGLDVMLQEIFGPKPHYWDPLGFLEIGPKIDKNKLEPVKGSFAVAAGLALRG